MNELDVIRGFRERVGPPDEQSVAAAYVRLFPTEAPAPRRRPPWALPAFAATLVAALLAAAGVAATRELGLFGSPVPPSSLTAKDRYVLGRVTPGGARVGVIAEHDGRAFYVLRGSGEVCYAVGPVGGDPRLASAICPGAERPPFPSPERPILDRSVFEVTERNQQAPYVTRLEGFAADAVRRVAIVTVQGERHTAPVVDNVYTSTRLPRATVREIVALDAAGHPLYAMCVQRGGCP